MQPVSIPIVDQPLHRKEKRADGRCIENLDKMVEQLYNPADTKAEDLAFRLQEEEMIAPLGNDQFGVTVDGT